MDETGRTRRITPEQGSFGTAKLPHGGMAIQGYAHASTLFGDQFGRAAAVLLILTGTVLAVAATGAFLARSDLEVAVAAWLAALPERTPENRPPVPSPAPVADANKAPEFGFVERFRMPGQRLPVDTRRAGAAPLPPASQVSAEPAGAAPEQAAPANALASPRSDDAAGEGRPADPAAPAAAEPEVPCPQPVVLGFMRDSRLPLAADLRAEAAHLSAWLGRFAAAELVIEGHTDSVGPDDLNRAVSEQRAHAIVDQLTGLGLARERLSVIGFGESRLLPAYRPNAAEQRRVVLRLTGIPGCSDEPSEPRP